MVMKRMCKRHPELQSHVRDLCLPRIIIQIINFFCLAHMCLPRIIIQIINFFCLAHMCLPRIIIQIILIIFLPGTHVFATYYHSNN